MTSGESLPNATAITEIGPGDTCHSISWFREQPDLLIFGINSKNLKVHDLRMSGTAKAAMINYTRLVYGVCVDPWLDYRVASHHENQVKLFWIKESHILLYFNNSISFWYRMYNIKVNYQIFKFWNIPLGLNNNSANKKVIRIIIGRMTMYFSSWHSSQIGIGRWCALLQFKRWEIMDLKQEQCTLIQPQNRLVFIPVKQKPNVASTTLSIHDPTVNPVLYQHKNLKKIWNGQNADEMSPQILFRVWQLFQTL